MSEDENKGDKRKTTIDNCECMKKQGVRTVSGGKKKRRKK